MEFFVPAQNDRAHAETIYSAVCDFMDANGIRIDRSKRYHRIVFTHNGRRHNVSIGEVVSGLVPEVAVVILDAGHVWLICTATRGVFRGEPILVGKGHDTHVIPFEDAEQSGSKAAG